MDDSIIQECGRTETLQAKQSFLASAIADISSYIHLVDTKVSILMAAIVAILVGMLTCADYIGNVLSRVPPCSWCGVLLVVLSIVLIVSVIGMFSFGLATIRVHSSKIGHSSKWFLGQSPSEYSFDSYKADVLRMSNVDIIEDMAAELYKLNDINRQKQRACKWMLRFFSVALASLFMIFLILMIAVAVAGGDGNGR